MPDMATISAFLTSIKTATDIAKALRQVDVSLDKAETKLRIADLMEALADARINAAEIQDVVQAKDNRIAELEKALEIKSEVLRHGDGYYEVDANGNPIGDSYCSHCWEVNHRLVHLHSTNSQHSTCSACNTMYRYNRVAYLQPPVVAGAT